jgi:Tol biopolymer transport system component
LDADSAGAYVSGHLLFVRQSALFAQNFDPVRLKLSGAAFQVAERVALSGRAQGGFALSTSRAGAFVFRPPSPAGLRQLTWVDRSGKEIGKAYDQPTSGVSPSISPDGRRVVLMRQEDANFDVWVLDLSRRVFTRLTSDLTIEGHPAWSPDGSRILFTSNQKGAFDLFEMPSAGGATKLVLATPESKDQMDWSPDARFVLYRNLADPKANSYDIWAVPLDGDRKPFPVVKTNYNERDGQFSPDGKWIAFQSNKSGRFQIYMQPFPGPGGELQLSTDGGAQARWRRDGKELFYIALDGRLMAVPIRLSANGQTVDASAPVPLFATHVDGAVQNTFPQQYAVSPDGQRFLMNNIIEEPTPITIVLNWKARP